jgi:hypothetical protein
MADQLSKEPALRALLVYPSFPDTFWSFRYALKFIGRKSPFPPLGLLTVAAMLPDAWEKRLVDLNVCSLRQEDLSWADCVFVSAMAVQRQSAQEVLDRCRAAGVRTVAGGPLFTVEPEAFPEVEHLVLGEAEVTLPQFLADLGRGAPQRVYRSKDFPELRATTAPLWHLADLKRYGSMNVQYSRGCPYHCEFCNVTTLFGRRRRPRETTPTARRTSSRGWTSPPCGRDAGNGCSRGGRPAIGTRPFFQWPGNSSARCIRIAWWSAEPSPKRGLSPTVLRRPVVVGRSDRVAA